MFQDNIPVMFAVLAMEPAMDHGQWLLVTLTAGVGGSPLPIGSAAGVAVMGQARGIRTCFSHLKRTWAIALGYAASIRVHFLINARHFSGGWGTARPRQCVAADLHVCEQKRQGVTLPFYLLRLPSLSMS